MTKLILVVLAVVTFTATSSFAKGDSVNDCTVASLIVGVNSDNFGLRTSSAYMLGELKCEKGVIPLMRMLKSEDREDARIVAALALLKIGNAKGIFAIKQAIRFDDSDRVRRLCANFYHSYSEKSIATELIAIR
jgi:HEAT repeat protein